jgi:hypothetical protein
MALLCVFLAACTILPRPARKWFWVGVGVVGLTLVVWVFLPDETEGWKPYTFDEELAALEAKYAIPDEENAATIYYQLIESDIEANLTDVNGYDSALDEPWSSRDFPRLAELLAAKSDQIGQLLRASKLERCKFRIPHDMASFSNAMRPLSSANAWGRLLTVAANNDMGQGRVGKALETHLAVLNMGKHLNQQPMMISHLSGLAAESLALTPLSRFVVEGEPNQHHLELICHPLGNLQSNWCVDVSEILQYDRLIMKNSLTEMLYEKNAAGKVRRSRDPSAQLRPTFPQVFKPQTYWRRRTAKLGVILGWFFIPPTPQKLGEMVDEAYQSIYRMADPDFDWRKERPEFGRMPVFVKWRLNFKSLLCQYVTAETYYRYHDIYMKRLALYRGLRILIALRQYEIEHETWPESLDQVKSLAPPEAFIDPATGGELTYENHGKRFSLYCEAANIWPR